MAILCIDAQKEFMSDEFLSSLTEKLRVLEERGQVSIATLFRNPLGSSWRKYMNWNECSNVKLPEGIKRLSHYATVKHGYSIQREAIPKYDILYLCGAELDGCILATAFTLWDAGRRFKIVEDMCYCKPAYLESAKQIIMHVFGNDIFIQSEAIV